MMEWQSSTFLKKFTIVTMGLVFSFIAVNVYVDIYGLWLGRKDRKVYVNERTSKYLLSFRYIPENFDGIIVGPSLSANLNPDAIKGFKVYNASIMGANISELKYLIYNVQERGNLRLAIICLDPYLTKDFGKKSSAIDPKEYYGALGSTNLLKTYLMYFVREFNLMPRRYSKDLISANGWNNFELEMRDLNPERIIDEKVEQKKFEAPKFDDRAYRELGEVVKSLKEKNVRILAYFSPIPYEIYQIGQEDYRFFETNMQKLFSDDQVLNLNDEKYKSVTSDYEHFIDHGHLSSKGQAFVLQEINESLEKKAPKKIIAAN